MMKNMTLENIAKAVNGTYVGPDSHKVKLIDGVTTDSREVKDDYLYVPFKGQNVDGHDFIPSAYDSGAVCVLTEKDIEPGDNRAYIKVESTSNALKAVAAYYREQLSCKIVGIIGSVGKTSTKEMVASVLSQNYRVQKTKGNYNNEVGLPLTICTIRDEHEVAVCEMGISDFDEMTRLATIAKPDVVIMTNIGNCHLEQLKDRDGVLKAKSEVIPFIKDGGALILNGDDDKLTLIDEDRVKVFYYGTSEKALNNKDNRVYATNIKAISTKGVKATLNKGSEKVDVEISIPGEHNVYNAMAAAECGLFLDMDMDDIKRGIENAATIEGRNNQFRAQGATVIDDCYNANPASMMASIKVLSNADGRRIAILGDMGELGENEKKLHYEVGEFIADCGVDILLTCGHLSEEIINGAKNNGSRAKMLHFFTKDMLIDYILRERMNGDTILVKASHFMEFSEIVDALR